MKKMKLVLLAAMIIGIGSAFTTAQPKVDELWVVGPDGVNLIEQSAAIELGGYCDGVENKCTFLDESGTPDPFASTGQYRYPTSK